MAGQLMEFSRFNVRNISTYDSKFLKRLFVKPTWNNEAFCDTIIVINYTNDMECQRNNCIQFL